MYPKSIFKEKNNYLMTAKMNIIMRRKKRANKDQSGLATVFKEDI